MNTPTPIPSSTPPKPTPPLPRAGTFRASRRLSTGPGGLRRGATFANRPQSFSGTDASLSVLEPENVDAVPRLRRGPSFIGRPRPDLSDESPMPQLRRGSSRRSSVASPILTPPGEGLALASKRLPRAGTFSYGSSPARPSFEEVDEPGTDKDTAVESVSSEDVQKAEASGDTCGMCSGCGGTGPRGMPPWAPERLKTMTDEERAVVLRELQQKEEMGRAEAQLRNKRLAPASAELEKRDSCVQRVDTDDGLENFNIETGKVATRIVSLDTDDGLEDIHAGKGKKDFRIVSLDTDGGLEEVYAERNMRNPRIERLDTDIELESRKSESITRLTSEELDELESVDLATEASGRSSSKSSKRRSRSGSTARAEEFGEDISAAVASERGKKGHELDADCAQCGELEEKVKDLEEQLGVLKEVVAMCADADSKENREEGRKPKTWKDKVLGAYFGGGSASSERSRLKEEVEALRKATDFLFHKLQKNEK